MPTADDTFFERPIATIDLAIFALSPTGLSALLTQRAAEPYAGAWALPGGFVHVDEDADLDAAARRILLSKTAMEAPYLEQLQTVGNAGRDPRGWSISVSYIALLGLEPAEPRPGANTADACWLDIAGNGVDLPLAFDHAALLAAHLLPPEFTLGELQAVYERILGRPLDKSAFRKRVAEADFVAAVPGAMRRASNRPAQLYRLRQPRDVVLFNRTL